MRITSILRAGTLALALTATIASFGTAFAAENIAAQAQSRQGVSTGVYDGAAWDAAKQVQDSQQY